MSSNFYSIIDHGLRALEHRKDNETPEDRAAELGCDELPVTHFDTMLTSEQREYIADRLKDVKERGDLITEAVGELDKVAFADLLAAYKAKDSVTLGNIMDRAITSYVGWIIASEWE